jgi:16S rRNA (adenine1518-N6/adenine1519-N6)-dimethyltransferase
LERSQRELLRAHGIRPVKRRGQNFLVDGNLARWIAAAVRELGPAVLELGAGAGALTTPLLAEGARVTAVEVDRKLCALLREELGGREGFRLIEGDLSQLALEDLLADIGTETGAPPVVAGNLPYVLTSHVLFGLADARRELSAAVLMIQREVAARLTARPGSRDYGVLSAVLGSLFAIEVIRRVPAEVFWPRPDVESAVVRLRPGSPWSNAEYGAYRETVKVLFGQRRKQLGSILRSAWSRPGAAATAGLDPARRPEQLSPEELRRLSAVLARGEEH